MSKSNSTVDPTPDRPHESARGHVTGRAHYVDDLPMPATTLHVATGFIRSPHATITQLKLDAVRKAEGVVDLITRADIPGSADIGPVFPGDQLLAGSEVEYSAQPLFAVAATSLVAAQRAARLAEITFNESSDPLLTIEQARAAGAFVLPSRTWTWGEPAAEFDKGHTEHTGQLYIRGQEHFYLEGQVATAQADDDGGISVVSSTQHPDDIQKLVARVLDLPMHKVRVQCRRMGGGFGGKETQGAPLACIAALFAQRQGCAVKYRMPRHDDMIQTGKRHDFDNRYRLAHDDQGLILAAEIDVAALCGYSPDLSDSIVDRAMFHACNAYYFPHAKIAGHKPKTHTVSNTAFRGFGGPQGLLTIEAAMDEIAQATGTDPLDVRKRNLFAPKRDTTPYGQSITDFVLPDILNKLEHSSDYRARREATNQFNQQSMRYKKGLALTPVQFGISFTATHLNQAGALVHIYRDGSVEISHAGTEMGQGLYTKVQQVAATAFGIAFADISHAATRTDKVPNGSPTAASSGSDLNGMATLAACDRLKQRLVEHLVTQHQWNAGTIEFRDAQVVSGSNSISFKALVAEAYMARVSLSATGFYRTPDIHFDKDAGRGQPFYYYSHGAAATEVMIDTSTGEYRVLRTDILHEVANSLNSAIDLGQVEGGFIQGMGWLTTEELLWNEAGEVISNSPANYKIPTAHDCPEQFNVALYNRPNPLPTVHRSKAVGEPPLMLAVSVWCALRNACAAVAENKLLPALAVPATPEAVFWACEAARAVRRDERVH